MRQVRHTEMLLLSTFRRFTGSPMPSAGPAHRQLSGHLSWQENIDFEVPSSPGGLRSPQLVLPVCERSK